MVDSLAMSNKIGIRLAAVKFPSSGDPSVVFELFADGYKIGDMTESLLKLEQVVPHHQAKHGMPDYDAIVREAAKKLEADFKRVVESLADTYSARSLERGS